MFLLLVSNNIAYWTVHAHRHGIGRIPSALVYFVVYHLAGHMAQRGHKVTVITRKHKQMPPTQTGVEVIPVRWAPLPMSFTKSFGKHAMKAIKQLNRRRNIDVINAHLPLVSWTRKQFRFLEENIAPVVSTLHGSWIGEREGVRRAALNREA